MTKWLILVDKMTHFAMQNDSKQSLNSFKIQKEIQKINLWFNKK